MCANNPTAQLVRYADLAATHKDLGEQLAAFFTGLYSQSFLNLAVLRAKIGDIADHYKSFVAANQEQVCPFCGLDRIKGPDHTKREAYDHYLPKALYPFNSVNFRNLAPACHECNSSYKLTKDPLHNPAGRRKAFNPYSAANHTVNIQVVLKHSDIDKLTRDDIAIEFGPATLAEELDTWKDLYGIEERYTATLCAKNEGKYWVTQVLDEFKWLHKQPADTLNLLARQAISHPYADCNFLRNPFLHACEQIGMFDDTRRKAHRCA